MGIDSDQCKPRKGNIMHRRVHECMHECDRACTQACTHVCTRACRRHVCTHAFIGPTCTHISRRDECENKQIKKRYQRDNKIVKDKKKMIERSHIDGRGKKDRKK